MTGTTLSGILFPLGVRLSTWVMLMLFLLFALRRRDRRFIFAALVWLASFEMAYDISMWILHPQHWYLNLFFFGASVATVAYFGRAIPRPDLRIGLVVAAIWATWIATGFHVNSHQMIGFDSTAEVLNEIGKTLLALAFLVPLLRVCPGKPSTRALGCGGQTGSESAGHVVAAITARGRGGHRRPSDATGAHDAGDSEARNESTLEASVRQ